MARQAMTAVETIATDANGSYAGITPKAIHNLVPDVAIAPGRSGAFLSYAKGTANSYVLLVTSGGGKAFVIERSSSGVIKRTCHPSGGGCLDGIW